MKEQRLTQEQVDRLAMAASATRAMTESARSVGSVSRRRAGLILGLHRSGLSTRRIATELGVSHTTIAKAVSQAQEETDDDAEA